MEDREKRRKSQKAFYLRHPGYQAAQARRWREKNPDYRVKRGPQLKLNDQAKRFSKYGVTKEDFKLMFDQQSGKCAICGTAHESLGKGLGVDHCHLTGKVRGLLCNRCNTALGLLRDNVELLHKCVQYLSEAYPLKDNGPIRGYSHGDSKREGLSKNR